MRKFNYLIILVLFLFALQGCKDGEIISEFTIEFDTQGGNEIDDIIINISNLDVTLPTPIKDGYTFVSWVIDLESNEPIDLTSMDFEQDTIKLYATWQQTTFQLIFSDEDGTLLHQESMVYNEFLEDSYVDIPTKEGYTFNGWDIDLPNQMPAHDVNVTATYTINRYRVNFETYEGSTIDSIEQDYQTPFSVEDPELLGYSFLGWYLDESFETPYTEFIIPVYDLTLYAKWERQAFMLTFTDFDGTLLHEESILYHEFLEDSYVDIPTKEGYTFNGWDIDLPNQMPAHDVNVTATYTINRYRVNFETYEGSTIDSIEQDYQTPFSVEDPELLGYSFLGWYLDESFETPYQEFIIPAYDLTLYAKYEIRLFIINFDTLGGTFLDQIYLHYMDAIVLPTPEKEGYLFDGWFLDINYQTPFTGSIMQAEDLNLYAKWIILEFNVYYELLGGTNHQDNPLIIDGATDVPLYEPTLEGFVFVGWFYDQQYSGSPITFIEQGVRQDVYLYAKWSPNQYSITYVMLNEPIGDDYAILNPNEQIIDSVTEDDYAMFLTSDHRVFAFGRHMIQELGTTNYPIDITPYFSLLEGEEIIEIYTGNTHAAVYTSMNRLFMFGSNEFGQIGLDVGFYSAPIPVDVTDIFNFYPTETIDLIALGYRHTIITTTHGRIFTFGSNYYGELGFPQTSYNPNRVPVEITLAFELDQAKLEHFKYIYAQENCSIVVTSEERVFVFGDNGWGALGLGTEFAIYETPTDITHLFNLTEDEEIVTVKVAAYSGVLITSHNRIFTWGTNNSGQLGLGYISQDREPVTEVIGAFDLGPDEVLVDASPGYVTMLLTSSGRIFMTGYKELIVGLTKPNNSQILFTEYTEYFDLENDEKIIKLGHSNVVARSVITSNGKMFSWGQTHLLGMGDNPMWIISYPSQINVSNSIILKTEMLYYTETIESYKLNIDGYNFRGWYTDSSLTTPFDLTIMPGNDLIIYGYYEVVTPD